VGGSVPARAKNALMNARLLWMSGMFASALVASLADYAICAASHDGIVGAVVGLAILFPVFWFGMPRLLAEGDGPQTSRLGFSIFSIALLLALLTIAVALGYNVYVITADYWKVFASMLPPLLAFVALGAAIARAPGLEWRQRWAAWLWLVIFVEPPILIWRNLRSLPAFGTPRADLRTVLVCIEFAVLIISPAVIYRYWQSAPPAEKLD